MPDENSHVELSPLQIPHESGNTKRGDESKHNETWIEGTGDGCITWYGKLS